MSQDIQHLMRAGSLHLQSLPPLSLYVHLPWCLQKCPYCDFNSHVRHTPIDEERYVRAFAREIETTAARTPGREGRNPRVEQGYIHTGPIGSGHFVKMVHNGIEYGLMQAYAEGFDILKNANTDALPADHRFDLDIADIAEVWRRGSVIPSWLLDLTASALASNHALDQYSGFVEDSGEGRWTINAAINEAVPAEVLTAALFARFRSRKDHTFAEKILSAMRAGFGGHKEPQGKR